MQIQLSRLLFTFKVDYSAFKNLTSKQKRKDMEVADILIINVIMLLILLSTFRSNLLNR